MNTSPEKLCLNWKNFQQNISSAFRDLRSDDDFSDVTLACADGFQVSAHKVILASSSPFFMNIFKMNKTSHPFIYMRKMKSEDLVAIVDFLYYGEAEIDQERLDSFLAVAEELKVTGLTTQRSATYDKDLPFKETEDNIQKASSAELQPRMAKAAEVVEVVENESEDIVEILETDNEPEPLVETAEDEILNDEIAKEIKVKADESDIGIQVRSMMDFSENRVMSNKKPGSTMGRARVCKVCGKEGAMGSIMIHIENNHIAKVLSPCDVCGTISKSRNGLKQHMLKKHSK